MSKEPNPIDALQSLGITVEHVYNYPNPKIGTRYKYEPKAEIITKEMASIMARIVTPPVYVYDLRINDEHYGTRSLTYSGHTAATQPGNLLLAFTIGLDAIKDSIVYENIPKDIVEKADYFYPEAVMNSFNQIFQDSKRHISLHPSSIELICRPQSW